MFMVPFTTTSLMCPEAGKVVPRTPAQDQSSLNPWIKASAKWNWKTITLPPPYSLLVWCSQEVNAVLHLHQMYIPPKKFKVSPLWILALTCGSLESQSFENGFITVARLIDRLIDLSCFISHLFLNFLGFQHGVWLLRIFWTTPLCRTGPI